MNIKIYIILILILLFIVCKITSKNKNKNKNKIISIKDDNIKTLYNNCGNNINPITEYIINDNSKKTIQTEFIKGNILKYNYNNNVEANKHYNNVIQMLDNEIDIDINDNLILNLIIEDIEEQEQQNRLQQNQTQFIYNNNNNNLVINQPLQNNNNNKNNNKRWYLDTQNVHDSSIVNSIDKQYKTILDENKKIDIYNQKINSILNEYSNQFNIKVINTIKERVTYLDKYNSNEYEILSNILFRIIYNQQYDENTRSELLNILKENINDCVESIDYIDYNNNEIKNENIICASGVVAKCISSFAHIDNNIGILKSKQIIRNEIFNDVSKLASDNSSKDSSLDSSKDSSKDGENSLEFSSNEEMIEEKINAIINIHKENHIKENIALTDNEYEYIKKECLAGF